MYKYASELRADELGIRQSDVFFPPMTTTPFFEKKKFKKFKKIFAIFRKIRKKFEKNLLHKLMNFK
jgi:hypothetical protein